MEKFMYGKSSKISNTFLFLFSTKIVGYHGWNSQNTCQHCKQGRSWSDCFFRSSLIWVCTVCPGIFGRQLVYKILEHLPYHNLPPYRVSYPKSQALLTVSSFKHHYFAQKESTANYMGCDLRKSVF